MPVADTAPLFFTTTVYVSVWPCFTGLGAADLVIDTSAHGAVEIGPGLDARVALVTLIPAAPLVAP